MTDYERGVEQASSVYKEVIREYVVENAKLRKLVWDMWDMADGGYRSVLDYEEVDFLLKRMRELGIEVDA